MQCQCGRSIIVASRASLDACLDKCHNSEKAPTSTHFFPLLLPVLGFDTFGFWATVIEEATTRHEAEVVGFREKLEAYKAEALARGDQAQKELAARATDLYNSASNGTKALLVSRRTHSNATPLVEKRQRRPSEPGNCRQWSRSWGQRPTSRLATRCSTS